MPLEISYNENTTQLSETLQHKIHNSFLNFGNNLDKADNEKWLSKINLSETEQSLVFYCENSYVLDWAEETLEPSINGILNEVDYLTNKKIEFKLKNEMLEMQNFSDKTNKQNYMSEKVSDVNYQRTGTDSSFNSADNDLLNFQHEKVLKRSELQLHSHLNFDNFVEGSSNEIAYAAAKHVVANSNKRTFNPLFIYGATAVGKTHLMCAIGNALKDKNKNIKVCFINAQQFVEDMVASLNKKSMNAFKNYYRSANVLLVDDIHVFSSKGQTQEEFFHTFNFLLDTEQQMIFTSDRYPKKINGLEERLKSRFGSGLTIEMFPPEFETRVAILQKKAQLSGFELNYENAAYIAQHLKSNARELEGAIKRIKVCALLHNNAITLDLIKDSIADLVTIHQSDVSISFILEEVASFKNITIAELVSQRRIKHLVYARHLAMYLCKSFTTKSLPEIGENFGGRDHTTVLHAYNKIKKLITTSDACNEDIKLLTRKLTQ